MLPRCAWPHATLRYPWACAQQLFAISTSSSCGAARFSESRQDDYDEGTEGAASHCAPGSEEYNEFYNIQFEQLPERRQRRHWHDHVAEPTAAKQAGSRRSGSTDSKESCHWNSGSSGHGTNQGRRGVAWFAHHWPGAGLGLEDVEGMAFEAEEGRFRSAKARRRGTKRQQGSRSWDQTEQQDQVWEDEGGFRWTEQHAGRSTYRKAFQQDERSWFDSWQWQGHSQRPGASAGSSHTSQHPQGQQAWGAASGSSSSSRTWQQAYASGGFGGSSSAAAGKRPCPVTAGHLYALGLGGDLGPACLTKANLKAAFHNVAKQWHPDRHADRASKAEAEVKFKRAAEAYEHLLKICV